MTTKYPYTICFFSHFKLKSQMFMLAVNCLERLVSEMIYYVSSGMLNLCSRAYSLCSRAYL